MAEKSHPQNVKKTRIHITGMTCTTCAATIEKALFETPGVEQVNINFASEKASIEYDPAKVDLAKLEDTISQLGYG
ncbi:MAG: heavy metal-associated domain-containing protein, partial [Dehalococcoidia bacterium]